MRLLITLGILACSFNAYAEKLDRTEINKALRDLKPVPLKNQGQDGIWFSTTDAEKLLGLIEKKLPQALDIIDAQDSQIATLKTSVDLYKATVSSYNDYATYNKNMLDTALKYFPELKPPEFPWYEKPAVTYIGGILTGAAIIVVSAYVLDKTNGNK